MAPSSTSLHIRWMPSRFDRMNILAVLLTLALFACFALYSALVPDKTAAGTTRHMMQYLGLVHFAVGYVFFFSSPAIRGRLTVLDPDFFGRTLLCAALSIACFRFSAEAEPLVYTLFYLHAAENAGYHVFRLGQAAVRPGTVRPTPTTIFPLLAVLLLLRVSPDYLAGLPRVPYMGQLGVVVLCFIFVRRLLPGTDWRAGWRVVAQQPWTILAFLAVVLAFPERSIAFDLFIIWHYVIWFIYTWDQKPDTRRLLIWAHALFLGIYKGVYLLYDQHLASLWPLLILLVSPWSFRAQTTLHILLSFAFRRFGASAPAQAR